MLNAGLEATGINAAASAGDAIGSGDLLGGGLDAAMSVGGGKMWSASTRFLGGAVASSYGRTVAAGVADIGQAVDNVNAGQIGRIFHNREGLLPSQPAGYYSRFNVPTPGVPGAGPQRLVIGLNGEIYWTGNHYASFTRVR